MWTTDQHTSREDLSKDGVHELIKHMPLGLLGSGLDDGSPMAHLSGLERVTLANYTNEQRAVLLDMHEPAFDARLDGLGSDMGPVELVPWKALSDATVRGAIKRLQKYHEARDVRTCPVYTRLNRLLEQAKNQRLPGASEIETACWPLLGCAMVGCYWLRKPSAQVLFTPGTTCTHPFNPYFFRSSDIHVLSIVKL